MGKPENPGHNPNSAKGKKENKKKIVDKSEDLNLTDDTLDSPVVNQKRVSTASLSTTAKIITEFGDKKMSMRKKSRTVDLDKDEDEDENENEDVDQLAKEIEKKCRILRAQISRDFPGKGSRENQGQGQLQVKIEQLEEMVNEKTDQISQLESKIIHMSEKQEMILSLLLENEDEETTKSRSKSKLKLAHLCQLTSAFSSSRHLPQHVSISTGIFKERDEFSDKDLRCTKIKTSRRIVLHGLGFSAPLDQDNEFKVSAVVRANSDKVEVGKWTKLLRVKKGEKILLSFDKPITLKAGKSYEIEYAIKGPRLENELSEKVPLTKTQRNNRGRARARGTPVHANEARFNFAAYDKEKYTVSTPGVTFQIRQFKEEKGALCLLSYSADFTAPRRNNDHKSRGKDKDDDQADIDDDEEESNEDAENDDNPNANGEEEKNVYVTSERYSESSSDESSSSDENDEKTAGDQQDD